jgi:hypothetical protein
VVVPLLAFPYLNEKLKREDLVATQAIADIAAQDGIGLGEAIEQSGFYDQASDDQVATMRSELDQIPKSLGRTIIRAVDEACRDGRPVVLEWEEIDPTEVMSVQAFAPNAEGVVRILVRTPHGRFFRS